MREHHREMTYLRKFIAHDDTSERHKVEAKITQAERDERCLRRAVWLMVVLAALAAVGLGYAAVFLEDYPQNLPRFFTHFMVRGSCALGLASLVSLICFVGLWALYRKGLHERRDECRRLAAKVVESRLGRAAALPKSVLLKGQEVPFPQSQTVPTE
jgi:hypothetical protein